jgi:hypothetical protein
VTPWLPRALAWTVVVAGPGSVVVSALLLAMSRTAFRHGPGVPTAGPPEALGGDLALPGVLALGHVVSVPASRGWAAARWRRLERLRTALGLVVAYNLLIALPLLAWSLLVYSCCSPT